MHMMCEGLRGLAGLLDQMMSGPGQQVDLCRKYLKLFCSRPVRKLIKTEPVKQIIGQSPSPVSKSKNFAHSETSPFVYWCQYCNIVPRASLVSRPTNNIDSLSALSATTLLRRSRFTARGYILRDLLLGVNSAFCGARRRCAACGETANISRGTATCGLSFSLPRRKHRKMS